MKIQKVVITGVTGFFGSALAKELLIRDVAVYGVGRNRTKLNELCKYGNFIPVESELSDYNKLPDLIKDPEIDVFYHMAWAGGFTTAIRDYSLQLKNAAWAGDALVAAKEIGAKKFPNPVISAHQLSTSRLITQQKLYLYSMLCMMKQDTQRKTS